MAFHAQLGAVPGVAGEVVDWKQLEVEVRQLAGRIWGRPCRAEHIDGTDHDGIIRLPGGRIVVIEMTKQFKIDKVRTDVTRIQNLRFAGVPKGLSVEGYIVLSRTPTPSMKELGTAQNIEVIDLASFRRKFFDYESYHSERVRDPFGSAVNILTGEPVTFRFVPVKYRDLSGHTEVSVDAIAQMLLDGENVLLVGDYGTGKSRCVSELYTLLYKQIESSGHYPIAINMRDHWGQRSMAEVVRRHVADLGLDTIADQCLRAIRAGGIICLLDGFDEIGGQSWSDNPARIRALRRDAVACIADTVQRNPAGSLICGRDYYFDSRSEMVSALGLEGTNYRVIQCKEEFDNAAMEEFIREVAPNVELPTWLPRRPLMIQLLADYSQDDLESLLADADGDADFWRRFITQVCRREARIRRTLESQTIESVLRLVARATRQLSADTGPVPLSTINSAFQEVVGVPPVDEAAIMLQRLPGMGQSTIHSDSRTFADKYILDGLRADDLMDIVTDRQAQNRVSSEPWQNPLGELGQKVLSMRIQDSGQVDPAFASARLFQRKGNETASADIVMALSRTGAATGEGFDFRGFELNEAFISVLDLGDHPPKRLSVVDCMIDEIVLPHEPVEELVIRECSVRRISGVSAAAGLPAWTSGLEVEEFQSVNTVSRIRDANLSPGHAIMAAMIRKTFFQRGAGRQENALLRGLGAIDKRLAKKILKLLLAEGLLDEAPGRDGKIYVPQRKHTRRMAAMLDQLQHSRDPLWVRVSGLDAG